MANAVLEVEERIRSHPGKTALVEWDARGLEHSLDFAGLGRRSAALSAALVKAGVGRGDRVLLLVPMSIDLYVCILAIIRMGAVCAFVDPHMGAKRFDVCCASARPKAFIGIPKAHIFRLLCPSLRKVPLRVATAGLPRVLARRLDDLIQGNLGDTSEAAAMSPEEPALITFTTGSSGEPKGSDRTHGFLRGQLEALNAPEKLASASDFPGFPILPLENLARGRTTYIPRLPPGKVREADPAVVLKQLARWRPEMMSGSPAYLEALADGAIAAGLTVDSVKILYTGGAPITPAALEKLGRVWTRASIQVVYGSTEAEPVAGLTSEEILGECQALSRRGMGCCVGYPVPSLEVLILPIDHKASEAAELASAALPPGQVGEIVVRGPHVNTGYWNNAGAVAANKIKTPRGIWHRMGDAGYRDAKGRLWVVGRVHTAMANPSFSADGNGQGAGASGPEHWPWIFPYQAELVADGFAEVRKAAYLEAAGGFYLVIEKRSGNGAGETALKASLRAALPFLPLKEIVFHPGLPVDARHNSKVEYGKVKDWLEKGAKA
jgi:acyl-CoA synthetase (AMP-forming)/AMP-acid ligase II